MTPSAPSPATQLVAEATRQLDALATEMVLGSRGVPEWIEALGRLAEQVRLAGLSDAAQEATGLNPGGAEFAARAQVGLERVAELLEKAGKAANNPVPAAKGKSLADDPELVADFIVELREHLASIEQQVLAIEQGRGGMEAIHALFRAFHTVKGLAGFLEFHEIQAIAHETETVLDSARNGNLLLGPSVLDIILESADYLGRDGRRIEAGARSGEAQPPADCSSLREKIRSVLLHDFEGAQASGVAALSSAVCASDAGTISLQISLEGEEEPRKADAPVTIPLESVPAVPVPVETAAARGPETRRNPVVNGIRVDIGKLDYLIDMVGEIVIAQSLVRHSPDLEGVSSAALQRSIAQLSRITGEVQKTAMSMRMVHVGVLFQKRARQVRDLARKAGKQVDLITTGEETELDRIIVEELADPLMHMIRNAIDHGNETAAERAAAGKTVSARLELRASHQSGCIQIEVSDDGRGMSRDKILAKARAKGMVAEGANLADSEVFNLVFEPGFSTAEKVTDISGRGVGMDVVKRHIQKLRGRTEIDTQYGRGTTFRLKLPLTLAIIDGLIVGVGQERYIVPIFAVKEILRPSEGMITSIENRREIALVRERVLPVVRLYRRFRVKPRTEVATESLLIITESHGREYCLMVDALLGKQEVVIKNLGQTFRDVQGIAGGAILGDGRVGLILDMNALFGQLG